MSEKLHINSVIGKGKYNGKKVSEIISEKKVVFSLIKEGFEFEDEVLSMAGIKKTVMDVKVEQVFVEHDVDTKVYAKETASLQKILKELRTLDDGGDIADEIPPSTNSNISSSNDYDEIDIDNL